MRGLANLQRYFTQLYANVSELRWSISERHPRLVAGQLIRGAGCSHLLWSDAKVHALLYKHLPVPGTLIRMNSTLYTGPAPAAHRTEGWRS